MGISTDGIDDATIDLREPVLAAARRAKAVAADLAGRPRSDKDRMLRAWADALEARADEVLAANAADVERARARGTSESTIDRLALSPDRVRGIAQGLRQVAGLADPVGDVVRGSTLANGLRIRQVRVPLGVVGMIYEARPNVTVDAAGLALKSGNVALLRGSSSALASNEALVAILRDGLREQGFPEDAVQLVPGPGHEPVTHLLQARGLVDVIIPRGGAGLISSVVRNSRVPVIETGVGNCHVYVDAAADLTKALAITLNAKTQRPSVCNAAETLLVHRAVADDFLPLVLPALAAAGVVLHVDERAAAAAAALGIPAQPANDDDWATEYHGLEMAVGVVDSVQAAAAHVRNWSSGHTEAIVSDSTTAVQTFIRGIDSAAVMVNASTRFTDGEQFGFGAEIGISTQKLHARGPMALAELTSTTWIVEGDGHIRE